MGRVRRSISAVTGAALALALLMAVLSWFHSPRPGFDAAANVFALLAAIAGIPAGQWAAARERRVRALRAIRQELDRNRTILEDDRFSPAAAWGNAGRRIYPRLVSTAVETALISGAFYNTADRGVLQGLYEWRNAVEEFNRRLDITEIYMFTMRTVDAAELRRLQQALHGEGGYVTYVCEHLESLCLALNDAEPERPQRVAETPSTVDGQRPRRRPLWTILMPSTTSADGMASRKRRRL